MIKLSLISFIFILLNSSILAQEIPVPENYSIIQSAKGDLDKDGQDELVVAYETKINRQTEESTPRELIIYKLVDKQWTILEKSKNALYGNRDGGMMGDPFGQLAIKDGILLIDQNGGSSWKWGHTDKYRYQNGAFILIGYTSVSGKPCEYWTNIDFNLSTGELVIEKEYEKCTDADQEIYKTENETFFKKGLKINLQNRNEKEVKIVSPKYRHEIYIAIKLVNEFGE
ncbi:hypothetical protein [Sphingobacterium hungaricum]|uniref:Uncharacterized protein n=1 Tax=Sphingobacterium hungaricum TaxID=2082723 RepID=A0A928UY52_9SPHI|nr:hypothetical protein [Sphingobacterium hungaricum]MBE8715163.1 hypothetical protein [Sphingobacterium hungaricum]